VPQLAREVEAEVARWPVAARLAVTADDKHRAFRQARAALAKSGTSTLELALAGVPMVAAYKLSAAEAAVAWAMIRVPSVILANLVLGEPVVPEYLQFDCRPDRLAAALMPLIADSPQRRAQVDAFRRLEAVLGAGSPSARAAAVVLAYAAGREEPRKEAMASDGPTA
jgi:lipid-A-disaccharide synthase